MAHKPADKAKGILLLVGGATLDAVSEELNVARSTVHRWSEEIKKAQGVSAAGTRIIQFREMFQQLAIETMAANIALARRVGDPDFLKDKSVDDVIKLSTHANEWFVKFDAAASAIVPSALPEVITPELVEED